MDHFAGFDPLLRVVLGRKDRIVLTGGPGFVAQVEHKLRAYTCGMWCTDTRWNWSWTSARSARTAAASDRVVRGRFVDHEMPCLAFAVEEKARGRVARDRLAALGVTTGPWLRQLKLAVLSGAPAESRIRVAWRTSWAGTR